ncbi:MAG: nucleotide exchange factor GrpE [Gemmatimonadota bacterium]
MVAKKKQDDTRREPNGDDSDDRQEGREGREGREGGDVREPAAGPETSSSKSEVDGLTTELEDLRDRHLRLAAEFDNFRKRTERERTQHAERAQAELVKQLLEPLDDLARVAEFDAGVKDPGAVVEGVELVERKLRRALGQSGLEPIEAVDLPFDPELHEALTTTPTEVPEEDGVVSQELTRGYLFKGTLVRPALVAVKKYEPGSTSTPTPTDIDADEGAGGAREES